MSSIASKRRVGRPVAATSKRHRLGTGKYSDEFRIDSAPPSKDGSVENVFEQLGLSVGDSRVETLKAELYVQILRLVHQQGFNQQELCKRWRKPQSRVSEVLNGKLNLVSIDTLVTYLTQIGATIHLKVNLKRAS